MDFDKNTQLIFNNKRYYFDVERISKFINHSDTHKIMEREIIDSYEQEEDDEGVSHMNAVGKTVREVSTQGNTNMDNIKYDLIKMFITKLIDSDISNDFEETLPFGIVLCIDKLIKEKILIEEKY